MKNLALIMLLLIYTGGCSVLVKKESGFFTKAEIEMLKSTTSAVGYDYGYDSESDLDYIFSNKYIDKELKERPAKLKSTVKKYDKGALVKFFEKVYILKFKTMKVMGKYRELKVWKEYTHVSNYLLPTLEKYIKMLEVELLANVPEYRDKISSRKKEIESIFKK